jgi:hypothetical protein
LPSGGCRPLGWYSLKPFPAHISSNEREEALFTGGSPGLLLFLSEESSESDVDEDSAF